jgi:hypothetical protein
MVAWWFCIIAFLAGVLFAAGIAGGVCLYGWRNKDKMARAMLRHMVQTGKAHADS